MADLVVVAYLLAAAVTAVLAGINWRHRRDSTTYGVISFMGTGVALLNVLNSLYILVPGETATWIVVSVESVVVPIVSSSVVCMALAIADRTWSLSRRAVLLLAIQPAAILVTAATNPWHRALFTSLDPTGLEGSFIATGGPIWWISLLYVQALLWGTALRVLVIRRRAASPAHRRVCARVLIAFTPPLVVAFVVPLLPFKVGDLISLGQAITMVYIQAALVGTLPRQIPVAHHQIFSAITDAVTVVDREGRIIEVNPAANTLNHRLVSTLPDDLTGLPIDRLFDLELRDGDPGELTLTNASDSGLDLHLLVNPLFDRRHNCIGWALVAREITVSNRRRREAEEATVRLREQLRTIEILRANLAERASHDDLTGLHNRRYLMETLEREVPRAQPDIPLSLAIIDLDHFKRINDTYGHSGGDRVLIAVAHLLTSAVRQDDVVARYGGEEFVIVFRGTGAETAGSRVQTLLERLKRTPIDVEGQLLSITFSAGVAELTPGNGHEDLLRIADTALYQAKRQGRDHVVLATDPTRTAHASSPELRP